MFCLRFHLPRLLLLPALAHRYAWVELFFKPKPLHLQMERRISTWWPTGKVVKPQGKTIESKNAVAYKGEDSAPAKPVDNMVADAYCNLHADELIILKSQF